jgi:signal transduction histidine kinase
VLKSKPLLRRVGSAGRLAILNSIILALVLSAVVAFFIRNFTSSYQSVAASSIGVELREFQQQALKQRPTNLETFAASFLRNHALAPGEVVVIDLTKFSQLSTPGSAPVLASPIVHPWLRTPPSRSIVVSTVIAGHPTELVGAPIMAGHKVVGTFIATSDLSAFAKERSREILLSIAGGAIALLAGVLSTFVLLRRLLRKVGRITTTADEIGSGTLDQRLGDQGSNDEVGELARTFDAMLDRVQAAMTAQRRLLSDVSHQLRTPLTVVRGHLEVLGRGGADDPVEVRETLDLVIDEIDHTRVVVERLLMLGRAMEPDFLDTRPVEVRALLDEVYEAVRVLADREFLLPQAPYGVVADLDFEKLRGALMNLVDNAVRATKPGDAIALVAEVDHVDEVIKLSVDDSGPGIPEDQRAAVLQRFSRPGARDRDGSGLGLAIVRAVAEGHGGRIIIETSDLGGARVTMVLPIARTWAAEEI